MHTRTNNAHKRENHPFVKRPRANRNPFDNFFERKKKLEEKTSQRKNYTKRETSVDEFLKSCYFLSSTFTSKQVVYVFLFGRLDSTLAACIVRKGFQLNHSHTIHFYTYAKYDVEVANYQIFFFSFFLQTKTRALWKQLGKHFQKLFFFSFFFKIVDRYYLIQNKSMTKMNVNHQLFELMQKVDSIRNKAEKHVLRTGDELILF